MCVILLLKSFWKILEITNVFLEEAQRSFVFFFSKKPDVNFVIWRNDNINFELSHLICGINTNILSC